MTTDPWILAFSAATVIVTIWMGFWAARRSKTASDFYVAGRSVSVGWNASAISGEYLSAASFMGIAGMVMAVGYDALWYPVCYACGYLFLLLFIAGPLRRFGAYTVPDLAEGRFDSPLFRKIAVVFVLFIGFFYTMPQMKGAGTTLAYIFPGLPYWAGVVLVGAVITLNVALGGMKGITLVQAFQYWAKMFAISVPIFVLMAVYGHYGTQLEKNIGQKRQLPNGLALAQPPNPIAKTQPATNLFLLHTPADGIAASPDWKLRLMSLIGLDNYRRLHLKGFQLEGLGGNTNSEAKLPILALISDYGLIKGKKALAAASTDRLTTWVSWPTKETVHGAAALRVIERALRVHGFELFQESRTEVIFAQTNILIPIEASLPAKARADSTWHYGKQLEMNGTQQRKIPEGLARAGMMELLNSPPGTNLFEFHKPGNGYVPAPMWQLQAYSILGKTLSRKLGISPRMEAVGISGKSFPGQTLELHGLVKQYGMVSGKQTVAAATTQKLRKPIPWPEKAAFGAAALRLYARLLKENGIILLEETTNKVTFAETTILVRTEKKLPAKAPADSTWLSPFGPLTTKAAKALPPQIVLPDGLQTNEHIVIARYSEPAAVPDQPGAITFKRPPPGIKITLNEPAMRGELAAMYYFDAILLKEGFEHGDGARYLLSPAVRAMTFDVRLGAVTPDEIIEKLGSRFAERNVALQRLSPTEFVALPKSDLVIKSANTKPYALLYTYSLIIALVCGTAGLPHILVRFYTNPDGVAAKRTTMWVMILIGIFYVFPPVFGVMGRNLFPELYSGIGAKGTDKIVLELPRLLNDKYAPLGSILSGITCAGAFAAFMSTFSGLLVSMTGAMAHDVYGRMLNPKATGEQRLRAFKIAAVGVGGVAIILGTFVEPLQINFMVGQAFAIAAASYFPLLFMCAWWRNLTMKGAATGMLTGGLAAVFAISLTSFSDLAMATDKTAEFFAVFKPLNEFWSGHPLLRILCEQPAIWAVPLAIGLMVVVSKLTRREVPKDIRMKMLVLHAPEKLGLKQEYIQEHQHH